MQFDWTYQVPYRRLAKLRWSMKRETYGTTWLLFLLGYAACFAAILGTLSNANALDRWMLGAGLPFPYGRLLGLAGAAVFFVGGVVLGGRFGASRIKSRANSAWSAGVRLTSDDSGLRFVTDSFECHLKWQGIKGMLVVRDGIVVFGGVQLQVFLVPDTAFPDAGTRLDFVRDVYGHLTGDARSLSEKYIRPVLSGDA